MQVAERAIIRFLQNNITTPVMYVYTYADLLMNAQN
jgi:hypothetical protein